MPITEASLKAKIVTEMNSAQSGIVTDQKFIGAIAKAIVNEITQNAVVVPTALVAPSGGGPVTGTGNIT